MTPSDISKNGGITTVSFDDPTSPYPSGSTHSLLVEASDTNGEAVSETREFTTPDYLTLDPALAVAGATTPGFVLDVWHVDVATATTVARAEKQLHGDLGPNVSLDQATFEPMYSYIEEGVINYAQDDEVAGDLLPVAAGNFTDANGFPDALIPGLNYTRGTGYTDNLATAIRTVLHFEEQGTYALIFNSDDGFRTTAAVNNQEVVDSVIVSQADVGKGASDVTQLVYIAEPGYYAMRTVWFEGGGGASLEWAVRTPSSGGEAMLINAPGSVMAYQVATGDIPPAVSFADPVRDSGNPYLPTDPIVVDIVDGSTPVNVGSVKLTLNGEDTGATASATDEGATISVDPDPIWPAGTHVVGIEFDGYSATYEFTVVDYAVLPAELATALGTGADPGMTWRAHQTAAGRLNFVVDREQQLVDGYGPSIHDPAGEVDGAFQIDFVNFEQDAGEAGNFTASAAAPQDVADTYLPGIPRGHAGGTDNIAAECETFVEFDSPGLKTMVVNSDDGFEVTSGVMSDLLREKKYVSLGVADYGKGASDVTFNIWVEQAGTYYMRLVWFEGGGGANCEWFTVNEDGSRALVGGTQTGSLPAYRTRSVAEPTIETGGGTPATIGLNFASNEADNSNSGTLAATDVAGVVPQANWNNLTGNTNPRGPAMIMDEDGNSTSVMVSWSANGTWATTGRGEENNSLTGSDRQLM
ncbi:MAG: PA14 domain-containing protein, partial [Xanthomonadales bacterium]|nr:PA14 domain-containing protein [Xanthomonadales bacterium]